MLVVGCDFDTYKATLVGLPIPREPAEEPLLEVARFRKDSQSGEDAGYQAMTRVATTLQACRLYQQADIVWIERGRGASRRGEYDMGGFFALLMATFARRPECVLNWMDTAEWKRAISAACGVVTKQGRAGNGNIKKELAHVYVQEVGVAEGHDIRMFGKDALDAYGICTTGRWLNEQALIKAGEADAVTLAAHPAAPPPKPKAQIAR